MQDHKIKRITVKLNANSQIYKNNVLMYLKKNRRRLIKIIKKISYKHFCGNFQQIHILTKYTNKRCFWTFCTNMTIVIDKLILGKYFPETSYSAVTLGTA